MVDETLTTDELQDSPVLKKVLGDALPQLEMFHVKLQREGETRGIIGPRDVNIIWERHILNSAAIVPFIRKATAQSSSKTVADVGSGGGFPGLVAAACLPDHQFTLIEPMERRVEWLCECADLMQLENVQIVRARAEDVITALHPVKQSRNQRQRSNKHKTRTGNEKTTKPDLSRQTSGDAGVSQMVSSKKDVHDDVTESQTSSFAFDGAHYMGDISHLRPFDVVICRAVAPLTKLSGWTLPLLRHQGCLIALKGRSAQAEINKAMKEIAKNKGVNPRVVDAPVGDGLEATHVVIIDKK